MDADMYRQVDNFRESERMEKIEPESSASQKIAEQFAFRSSPFLLRSSIFGLLSLVVPELSEAAPRYAFGGNTASIREYASQEPYVIAYCVTTVVLI